jgi:hypothetical protein
MESLAVPMWSSRFYGDTESDADWPYKIQKVALALAELPTEFFSITETLAIELTPPCTLKGRTRTN